MDELIGATINNFEIKEMVGKGGMGIVYRAYHPDLQTSAAIKVLRPEMARQSDFYKRFLQEARTAARLYHPNIINVLNFGKYQDYYYLMMDFIGGPSLRQLLRENPEGLPLWDVVQIFLQIADVMAFAHEEGVLHRDLKPDNILLTASVRSSQPYRVIITDFGLVKLAENSIMETQKGFSVGTPAYMSPEQIRGQDLDGRSDLYAIGVMMYECIIGKRPFPIRNHFDAAKYHAKGQLVSLRETNPRVPIQLDNLVKRLLSVEVKHRPADARELVTVLEKLAYEIDPERNHTDSAVHQRVTSSTRVPVVEERDGATTEHELASNVTFSVQIFFEGGPRDELVPIPEGRIVVGRQRGADIVLEDKIQKSVSRRHCEILCRGNRVLVRDLNSTNGTFLGGTELKVGQYYEWSSPQQLRLGPGPFSLALIASGPEGMADPAAAAVEDRTQVATHNVYVVCDDATPGRLPIASAPITVGRQDTCDIVLANGRVSRQHCQLQRRGLVVEITDLGSSNGTFLDGKRLQPHTPTAWNPESELQISPFTLHLEI